MAKALATRRRLASSAEKTSWRRAFDERPPTPIRQAWGGGADRMGPLAGEGPTVGRKAPYSQARDCLEHRLAIVRGEGKKRMTTIL